VGKKRKGEKKGTKNKNGVHTNQRRYLHKKICTGNRKHKWQKSGRNKVRKEGGGITRGKKRKRKKRI